MTNDTCANALTCIRNAIRLRRYGVEIPKTKMTKAISKILLEENLIGEILEFHALSINKTNKFLFFLRFKYLGICRTSILTILQRISRFSFRVYVPYAKIPRVLGGLGLAILSTSRGIITDRIARRDKVGGELICFIWSHYNF